MGAADIDSPSRWPQYLAEPADHVADRVPAGILPVMRLSRRVRQRLALNRRNDAAPPGLSPAFDERIPRDRASYQPGRPRLLDRLRRSHAVGERRRGDGGDAAGGAQPPAAPWAPATEADFGSHCRSHGHLQL